MSKSKSTSCFCFACCDEDTDSEHSVGKPVPEITLTKENVTKSNSIPINYVPINVNATESSYSPVHLSPNTNETSLSGSSINGKKGLSNEDMEAWKQGIRNSEVINSGGTIEANHKYISKVMMPNDNIIYTHPASRANSFRMPPRSLRLSSEVLDRASTIDSSRQIVRRNTERIQTGNTLDPEQTYMSLRNSEVINTGRTIEAEHTYTTTVAVPLQKGHYPPPRTNSLRRPIHLILYPSDSLSRKESFYVNAGRVPISRTRSLGFQL